MRRAVLLSLTLLLAAVPAQAGEIGHYAPGVLNVRDFFVPESGWYLTVYNVYYNTDSFRDGSGDKVRSITIAPGPSHVSWNWGISQYLPLTKDESLLLEIGPTGYSQWQVSDDRGRAARNPSVHDEVHAAGLQLGLTHVPWAAFLTARYLHEFGAQDRFEGQMVTLSIGKKL